MARFAKVRSLVTEPQVQRWRECGTQGESEWLL
jgi:hypothetical protein